MDGLTDPPIDPPDTSGVGMGTDSESTGSEGDSDSEGSSSSSGTPSSEAPSSEEGTRCGDRLVSPDEECDGESAACDPDCTFSVCGDGLANLAAGEECDTGGASATCDIDCTGVVCGDGLINRAAGEECEEDDLGDATCERLGFSTGTLGCSDACAYDVEACVPVGVPFLRLTFSAIKQFEFRWFVVPGTEFYQIEESVAPGEPFVQLGDDLTGESMSWTMPLHFRSEASYRLRACNHEGCSTSVPVDVTSSMNEAIGYMKAASATYVAQLGHSVSLSEDGKTLAIGSIYEDSYAPGINHPLEGNDDAIASGAVYVFVRDDADVWSRQAFIKSNRNYIYAYFGADIELSGDGNTLAVGASNEERIAYGAGSVYVFVRDDQGQWSQQVNIDATVLHYDICGDDPYGHYDPWNCSDTGFGSNVALSENGDVLAVTAPGEDSGASGINGDEQAFVPVRDEDSEPVGHIVNSGATYVYVRGEDQQWSRQVYIKASNPNTWDVFGTSVALSGDGTTLAVGAAREDSDATGIQGDQASNAAEDAGAVYLFTRNPSGDWSQSHYVKASNTRAGDHFGGALSLSGDGTRLVVGAPSEDTYVTGVNGDETTSARAESSGAAYVFAYEEGHGWSQQAYVKPSNTANDQAFGSQVVFSRDGRIFGIGAPLESSNAIGIDGDGTNQLALRAGAVYIFAEDDLGDWSQRAYVKASNTEGGDHFGAGFAFSGNGDTLAVGAPGEDSWATGIGGDQADNTATEAGAVYVY